MCPILTLMNKRLYLVKTFKIQDFLNSMFNLKLANFLENVLMFAQMCYLIHGEN